jgi:hypothetical protein
MNSESDFASWRTNEPAARAGRQQLFDRASAPRSTQPPECYAQISGLEGAIAARLCEPELHFDPKKL